MQTEQLKTLLDDASRVLARNQEIVTAELLDKAEALVELLSMPGAALPGLAAKGIEIKQLVEAFRAIIALERGLMAGKGEQLRQSIDKVRGRPLVVIALAKIL